MPIFDLSDDNRLKRMRSRLLIPPSKFEELLRVFKKIIFKSLSLKTYIL